MNPGLTDGGKDRICRRWHPGLRRIVFDQISNFMADKRRQFIKRSGALLGAAVLAPVSGVEGTTAPARVANAVPKPVADFLSRCGAREFLLRGGSVLSTANPHVSINCVVVS